MTQWPSFRRWFNWANVFVGEMAPSQLNSTVIVAVVVAIVVVAVIVIVIVFVVVVRRRRRRRLVKTGVFYN